MDVRLLYHTPDPERAIATAARQCYANIGAAELLETMTDETVRKVLKTVLESGHTSTLEHASYTFAIEFISRVATHMLVRHRLASFNQQSQRYTTYKEGEGEARYDLFVIPRKVLENPDPVVLEKFQEAGRAGFKAYFDLIELGVQPEDARYILPFGAESKIAMTVNVRELLHILSLRCCRRAQDEFQELAWKMLELVEPTAPYIFQDAGPSCVRGKCPEGKMTCGDPYPRAPRRE